MSTILGTCRCIAQSTGIGKFFLAKHKNHIDVFEYVDVLHSDYTKFNVSWPHLPVSHDGYMHVFLTYIVCLNGCGYRRRNGHIYTPPSVWTLRLKT